MKKILIILPTVFLLFTSCVSSKYFYEHSGSLSYMDSSLAQLEGTYRNYPFYPDENDIRYHSIASLDKLVFNPFHLYRWDEKRNTEGEIYIKVLSNKEIEVAYIKDNEVIMTKKLKGKFVNNYFEVNTRRRVIGIPLTYFIYDEEKLNLGISGDGDLIVSCGRYHFGSLFIICGDSNHDHPLSYFKRVENYFN